MVLGAKFGGASYDRSTWLVLLFLVAGVAAPVGAVLWFMNAAAATEAVAAKQSVVEAYRGQLRLVREPLDKYWQARAVALGKYGLKQDPNDFQQAIADQKIDSVLFLATNGRYLYPDVPAAPEPDLAPIRVDFREAQMLERQQAWQAAVEAYSVIAKSEPDASLAARAAQGQIRSLLQINKAAATNAILEYFAAGRLAGATDVQGRIFGADEHLLALRLMQSTDPRRDSALRRLTAWVNDYRLRMPSAQRLFLMHEVGGTPQQFPTYEAERLAAQVLAAELIRPGAGLEATRVAGVWKLTASSGRVIALLRTSTVTDSMRTILSEAGSAPGVLFEIDSTGARAARGIYSCRANASRLADRV